MLFIKKLLILGVFVKKKVILLWVILRKIAFFIGVVPEG